MPVMVKRRYANISRLVRGNRLHLVYLVVFLYDLYCQSFTHYTDNCRHGHAYVALGSIPGQRMCTVIVKVSIN